MERTRAEAPRNDAWNVSGRESNWTEGLGNGGEKTGGDSRNGFRFDEWENDGPSNPGYRNFGPPGDRCFLNRGGGSSFPKKFARPPFFELRGARLFSRSPELFPRDRDDSKTHPGNDGGTDSRTLSPVIARISRTSSRFDTVASFPSKGGPPRRANSKVELASDADFEASLTPALLSRLGLASD